jgi:hypothetical protein
LPHAAVSIFTRLQVRYTALRDGRTSLCRHVGRVSALKKRGAAIKHHTGEVQAHVVDVAATRVVGAHFYHTHLNT